jgi:hypothetical protein
VGGVLAREEEERADDDDQRPHDPEVEAAHASSAVLARNSVAARARSRPRRSAGKGGEASEALGSRSRDERPPGSTRHRHAAISQPRHLSSLSRWQHRVQRTSPNSSRWPARACSGHERSRRHSGDFAASSWAKAVALARACACDSQLVHPAVQLVQSAWTSSTTALPDKHASAAGAAG